MDSFLWPLIHELLCLAAGISTYNILKRELFLLRAHLIVIFGDIPAISMVMWMKGHNGFSPCRMCEIQGLQIPGSSATTHYVPLYRTQHPHLTNGAIPAHDPAHLPLRTHERILA